VVRSLPGDTEQVLRSARPGMMVGELAVLDGGARSASLRATRRSVLREIGVGAFEAVTLHGAEAGHRILRGVAASVHERLKMTRSISATGGAPRTEPLPSGACLGWSAATAKAVGVLGLLPAFVNLDASDWRALIPNAGIVDVGRGADLVLPETSNPGVVIVLRGTLSPWLDDASGPEVTMPAIGPGGFVDYAAALGLEAERRRWRARSPTKLLRLDPACFEAGAPWATRLLYALSRDLATTLRRSTGLFMHFRMAWVQFADAPGQERERRQSGLPRDATDRFPRAPS
jgi:CRP-like cAMP-binding protein